MPKPGRLSQNEIGRKLGTYEGTFGADVVFGMERWSRINRELTAVKKQEDRRDWTERWRGYGERSISMTQTKQRAILQKERSRRIGYFEERRQQYSGWGGVARASFATVGLRSAWENTGGTFDRQRRDSLRLARQSGQLLDNVFRRADVADETGKGIGTHSWKVQSQMGKMLTDANYATKMTGGGLSEQARYNKLFGYSKGLFGQDVQKGLFTGNEMLQMGNILGRTGQLKGITATKDEHGAPLVARTKEDREYIAQETSKRIVKRVAQTAEGVSEVMKHFETEDKSEAMEMSHKMSFGRMYDLGKNKDRVRKMKQVMEEAGLTAKEFSSIFDTADELSRNFNFTRQYGAGLIMSSLKNTARLRAAGVWDDDTVDQMGGQKSFDQKMLALDIGLGRTKQATYMAVIEEQYKDAMGSTDKTRRSELKRIKAEAEALDPLDSATRMQLAYESMKYDTKNRPDDISFFERYIKRNKPKMSPDSTITQDLMRGLVRQAEIDFGTGADTKEQRIQSVTSKLQVMRDMKNVPIGFDLTALGPAIQAAVENKAFKLKVVVETISLKDQQERLQTMLTEARGLYTPEEGESDLQIKNRKNFAKSFFQKFARENAELGISPKEMMRYFGEGKSDFEILEVMTKNRKKERDARATTKRRRVSSAASKAALYGPDSEIGKNLLGTETFVAGAQHGSGGDPFKFMTGIISEAAETRTEKGGLTFAQKRGAAALDVKAELKERSEGYGIGPSLHRGAERLQKGLGLLAGKDIHGMGWITGWKEMSKAGEYLSEKHGYGKGGFKIEEKADLRKARENLKSAVHGEALAMVGAGEKLLAEDTEGKIFKRGSPKYLRAAAHLKFVRRRIWAKELHMQRAEKKGLKDSEVVKGYTQADVAQWNKTYELNELRIQREGERLPAQVERDKLVQAGRDALRYSQAPEMEQYRKETKKEQDLNYRAEGLSRAIEKDPENTALITKKLNQMIANFTGDPTGNLMRSGIAFNPPWLRSMGGLTGQTIMDVSYDPNTGRKIKKRMTGAHSYPLVFQKAILKAFANKDLDQKAKNQILKASIIGSEIWNMQREKTPNGDPKYNSEDIQKRIQVLAESGGWGDVKGSDYARIINQGLSTYSTGAPKEANLLRIQKAVEKQMVKSAKGRSATPSSVLKLAKTVGVSDKVKEAMAAANKFTGYRTPELADAVAKYELYKRFRPEEAKGKTRAELEAGGGAYELFDIEKELLAKADKFLSPEKREELDQERKEEKRGERFALSDAEFGKRPELLQTGMEAMGMGGFTEAELKAGSITRVTEVEKEQIPGVKLLGTEVEILTKKFQALKRAVPKKIDMGASREE